MQKENEHNMISVSSIKITPIGMIWLAYSFKGLTAIDIGGNQGEFLRSLPPGTEADYSDRHDGLHQAAAQILEYLDGTRREFELTIDWTGVSNFQRKALTAVYDIPYGETRSYGQIAAQIGKPQAPRAVGRANATNPIPLVIPCHRVIGADGNLRGYGAGDGIKTKAWLLDLEKRSKPNKSSLE